MFKTFFRLAGFVWLAGTLSAVASAVSITDPVDLARTQEILSKKIVTGYSRRQDISQVLHRLEEQQNRLKNSIHDPEISNMIDFLQLCLENIKNLSHKPRSKVNAEKIADLGASINEASRYIVRKLD